MFDVIAIITPSPSIHHLHFPLSYKNVQKVSFKCYFLPRHAKEQCPERTVSCGYCKVQLKKKNFGTIKGRDPTRPFFDAHSLGAITDADVTGHLKVCPKLPLSCEFHPFGCSEKIVRQRMAAHHAEKAQHHAALVTKKTKSIEDKMADMKQELQTKVENAGKRIKKELLWKVDRERLRGQGNKVVSSKAFTVAGYELKFCLAAANQAVTVGLYIDSAPNRDSVLLGNISFESTVGTAVRDLFDDREADASFRQINFLEVEIENDRPVGWQNVVRGPMKWYDEERRVGGIHATKDQLLAGTCDSATHIHIVVKFELIVPDQEVVYCLSPPRSSGAAEEAPVWWMERVCVQTKSGDKTAFIKEINANGTAVVEFEDKSTTTLRPGDVTVATPKEHDTVLVIGGADVGVEGELICINGTDAILKDTNEEFRIIDFARLAKIRAPARTGTPQYSRTSRVFRQTVRRPTSPSTSPAYSPTSPAYSPTSRSPSISPAYSPPSPE